MAIIDKLKEIGNAIREKTGKTELILLSDIPKEIDTVFNEGRKAQNSDFWDAFQNDGDRTDYYAGFAGVGWTNELFKPKHSINPIGSAYGIFQKSMISGDLVEIAKEQNIEIDFSNATSLQYAFANTAFSRIGVINASNCASLIRAFETNLTLKIIDKIVLNDKGTTSLANAFNACSALEEIRFDGVIGANDINFESCKLLSRESLMSIINALKDRSGESTAFTCTLGAENLAKLTADEIKTATDKGWTLV